MAGKTKRRSGSSKSNIDLGPERKRRIEDLRAKKHLEKQPLPLLDDAVNYCVDRTLEAEGIA